MPCPAGLAHIAARQTASMAASSAPVRNSRRRSLSSRGEQAAADLTVGGEPGPVASAAEGIRHRRDDADRADAAVDLPQLRRSGSPRRGVGLQIEVAAQRGEDGACPDGVVALPLVAGVERHLLDDSELVSVLEAEAQ